MSTNANRIMSISGDISISNMHILSDIVLIGSVVIFDFSFLFHRGVDMSFVCFLR